MGQGDGRRHDVALGPVVGGHPAQLVERGADRGGVAPGPPALHVRDLLGLDAVVDLEDVLELAVAEQRGRGGLGVAVDADHLLLARLDAPHPLGLAAHEPPLELVDRLEGAAERLHVGQLGPGRFGQLCRLGLDHHRPSKMSLVLEQVGLEGEDLLHAQGPLLVPGPRQPERLVPGRQLHGAGPGALGQRDAERLEDDALHVVLRLLLGQPERVHLHAIAEAAELGVLDPVALAADAVPQLR